MTPEYGVPMDRIVEISSRLVEKPLPRELKLGAFAVRTRQYAIIKIETASGLVGHSYAQTRGAPIVEIIDDLLAPQAIGKDAASIAARSEDWYGATVGVGRTGLVMRAISLLDIALWDIQARRAGLPLHTLLGGSRSAVPAIFIAGYPAQMSDIEETVDSACAAVADGFSVIKIARASDPRVTTTALQSLATELPAGTSVIVDASWVWRRADQAIEEIHLWPQEIIRWVEDPFPPEMAAPYARLKRDSSIHVAAGDEVTDVGTLVNLVRDGSIDIARLDIATIGGISGAVRAAHQLEPTAVPISTHISTEVSAQFAGAFTAVNLIETFDRTGNRFDPSHELFEGGPEFSGGCAKLPPSHGLGLTPTQ